MSTGIGEKRFFVPEGYTETQRVESPRGQLLLASCRSGDYLAERIAQRYSQYLQQAGGSGELSYLASIDYQFSDGETCVRLEEDVSGNDVYLFQGHIDPISGRSIDQNYMAFLIAARTFREWGANHVTALLPYLAYARQDKPTKFNLEPTTANLMADLSIEAGIDRLIIWSSHSPQIHGFYEGMPVHNLEALPLFIEEFRHFQGHEDVIAVAPDAGASKLITHFARELNISGAIASKYRPRPEVAVISEIIGDFTGMRAAIVLDDMISSGGTVYEVTKQLVKGKGIEEVYLGVSHNLGLEVARQRMLELHADFHLKQVVVTNSIQQPEPFSSLPFFQIRDLTDILTLVVNRIHHNRPINLLSAKPG